MRFWKRDLNLAGTVGSGREDNYSKRIAGEKRVNVLWERVGAEYNLATSSLMVKESDLQLGLGII